MVLRHEKILLKGYLYSVMKTRKLLYRQGRGMAVYCEKALNRTAKAAKWYKILAVITFSVVQCWCNGQAEEAHFLLIMRDCLKRHL